MTPGPRPFPRRKLHPKLRDAAQGAMRDGRPPGATLALVSGYSHQAAFSKALHARRVSATPLAVARLSAVAAAVGYEGPLFVEEEDRP